MATAQHSIHLLWADHHRRSAKHCLSKQRLFGTLCLRMMLLLLHSIFVCQMTSSESFADGQMKGNIYCVRGADKANDREDHW